jgi:pilus assembly protein CpaF
MVAMSNLNIPTIAVRRQIASAISVVIQVSRLSDGSRKVTSVSEITGMEGDVITMQEIFAFKKHGVSETGEVLGEFGPTGVRPKFAEQLAVAGIALPAMMFQGAPNRG